MRAADWFRRTSWTADDCEDFHVRLRRSRGSGKKAQYLRIQAVHLAQVGAPALHEAALVLLEELLREHPVPIELAQAHCQRGASLRALGRGDDAIVAYQEAIAAQARFPNVRTLAALELAETALALDRRALFVACLAELANLGESELLPVTRFRAMAARACICESLGERTAARQHAADALGAAEATASPFARHRELGLVDAVPHELRARLERLAGRV